MTSPFIFKVLKNENEENFKIVFLNNIFKDNIKSFLFVTEKEEEKIHDPFIFILDYGNIKIRVLNLIYFLKNKSDEVTNLYFKKYKKIFDSNNYTEKDLIKDIKNIEILSNNEIEKKVNIYNKIFEKFEHEHNTLVKGFKLKPPVLNDFKLYFKLKNQNKVKIINVFDSLTEKKNENISFVIMCLDELNDYNLRDNFNYTDLQNYIKKFINPFINLNYKNNISNKFLSKFEKKFYNKKYIFFFNEDLLNENFVFPDKNIILNLEKNQIFLYIKDDSNIVDKYSNLLFLMDKKTQDIEGYVNSLNSDIIDIFLNDYIKQNFDIQNIILTKLFTKGYLEFENKNILEIVNENIFNLFINLYKPYKINRIIYTLEKHRTFYEKTNSSFFYFLSNFYSYDKEEYIIDKISNNSIKYNYKPYFNKEEEDIEEDIEENTEKENKSYVFSNLNNIQSIKNIIEQFNKNIIKNDYIRFVSTLEEGVNKKKIEFFCSNKTDDIEKLIYNIEETFALLIKHREIFEPIKNLLNENEIKIFGNIEKNDESEDAYIHRHYKTDTKKLMNLERHAKNEIVKGNMKDYSDVCQCKEQPILFNNKTEIDDWNKKYKNINDKFFSCLNDELIPRYIKGEVYLCCKKKETNLKTTNNYNYKTLDSNITEELISFFEIAIFKKKNLNIYKKKSNITFDESSNYYRFKINEFTNENVTTDPSLYVPCNYNITDPKKPFRIFFNDEILIIDEKDSFSFNNEQTNYLNFIFDDYNKFFSIKKNLKEKKKINLNSSYEELAFQIVVFVFIKDTLKGEKTKIIFSDNTYQTTTVLENFLKHFYMIFEFTKTSLNISPYLQSEIYIHSSYKDNVLKLMNYFENTFKNFFLNLYNIKNIIKYKDVSIKIPISFKNYFSNRNLLLSLKEFEDLKTNIFIKNRTINKNNCFFISNNPNFLLPQNSYHAYNLYYNNVNYNKEIFNYNIYTELFIVCLKDKFIKILNPNILLEKKSNIKIYEFDIFYQSLELIFEFHNESEYSQCVIFAPFNSQKINFDSKNDFINYYIRKLKLSFIPFENIKIN